MKTLNTGTTKISYMPPTVERIQLDNEISLALESNPATPSNGDEVYNTPANFNNDPFKTHLG